MYCSHGQGRQGLRLQEVSGQNPLVRSYCESHIVRSKIEVMTQNTRKGGITCSYHQERRGLSSWEVLSFKEFWTAGASWIYVPFIRWWHSVPVSIIADVATPPGAWTRGSTGPA